MGNPVSDEELRRGSTILILLLMRCTDLIRESANKERYRGDYENNSIKLPVKDRYRGE